jgi:hypothetical protein
MPTESRIDIPFLPQESITKSILAAIQLANEHHAQNQQAAIAQQQANTQQQAEQSQAPLRTAQTGLVGAQTEEAKQNVELNKASLDMQQREMEYVFGAGGGGGQSSGETGPHEQKPGLFSDIQIGRAHV